MKTHYTSSEISDFLENRMTIDPKSLTRITEGHSSQVFVFSSVKQRLVMCIRDNEQDLLADKYAYEHFSQSLPIPAILEVGRFDYRAFFCISDYVDGATVSSLEYDRFSQILPKIQDSLADTFRINVSGTDGYGDIDVVTGKGGHESYKAFLRAELALLGVGNLRNYARMINLNTNLIDQLIAQFENNLPYVSEVRRVSHGDPGGDNMIVNNGVVKAIIDWEQMAYADWMRDFSRFEYYSDDRYGNADVFAEKYGLEADNLPQRKAAYWAMNALRDIEFAATQNSEIVAQRLRRDITQKILSRVT